jgi:hypothetical protein
VRDVFSLWLVSELLLPKAMWTGTTTWRTPRTVSDAIRKQWRIAPKHWYRKLCSKVFCCNVFLQELEPNLAEPHRIRAYALYRLGKFTEAASDATVACELFGSFYAKAHYTRGLALLALAEQHPPGVEARKELKRQARADMDLAVKASPNVANEL